MKKVFSVLLALLFALTLLTGCGQSDTAEEDTTFDTTRFSLSRAVSGVEFLYPKEVDGNLYSYNDYDAYTPQERKNMYFEYTNGTGTYSIFQSGNMGIYCFSVGDLNHLEGKTDVNMINHYLGISSYLSFAPRGDEEYKTVAEQDGTIKNVFYVTITDHMINESFDGYLTVLKRGSDAKIFALAVGYSSDDDASMSVAAEIINSFIPCTSNE